MANVEDECLLGIVAEEETKDESTGRFAVRHARLAQLLGMFSCFLLVVAMCTMYEIERGHQSPSRETNQGIVSLQAAKDPFRGVPIGSLAEPKLFIYRIPEFTDQLPAVRAPKDFQAVLDDKHSCVMTSQNSDVAINYCLAKRFPHNSSMSKIDEARASDFFYFGASQSLMSYGCALQGAPINPAWTLWLHFVKSLLQEEKVPYFPMTPGFPMEEKKIFNEFFPQRKGDHVMWLPGNIQNSNQLVKVSSDFTGKKFRKSDREIEVPLHLLRNKEDIPELPDVLAPRPNFLYFLGSLDTLLEVTNHARATIKDMMTNVTKKTGLKTVFRQMTRKKFQEGTNETTVQLLEENMDQMAKTVFCPQDPGETELSARMSDIILAGCIPVLLHRYPSPLPLERTLDWSAFSVQINETSLYDGSLEKTLMSYQKSPARIIQLRKAVYAVRKYFMVDSSCKSPDGVDAFLHELALIKQEDRHASAGQIV